MGCISSAHVGSGIQVGGQPQDGSAVVVPEVKPKRGTIGKTSEEDLAFLLDDIIKIDIVHDKVMVVTLLGSEASTETLPWGTRICEHRLNPLTVSALQDALDTARKNPNISAIVLAAQGKYFCNGFDLQWVDAYGAKAGKKLQQDTERLLAKLLCFPLPTIAAVNGHFCAAGAMLGLAFDYRIMNAERGLSFVPGIDLGLAYSKGMTLLMKAKLPIEIHNDYIVYGTRYTSKELKLHKVVNQLAAPHNVRAASIELALKLIDKGRFGTEQYRQTMEQIKLEIYRDAHDALQKCTHTMDFAFGTWDKKGK